MSETSSTDAAGETFAEIFNNMTNTVKEGELAQGKILSIDDDFVTVDVGFKSEGMIASWEFMDDDGNLLFGPGGWLCRNLGKPHFYL